MRKRLSVAIVVLFTTLASLSLNAQNITISGSIKNSASQDAIPAVSVNIKGSGAGTFSDERGNFRLTTAQRYPITLVFTSIGYEMKEVTVNSAEPVQVQLNPASTLGTEVVVSASRVPERILESPVTIERINAASIRTNPASTYYDVLANLKGVDLTASSLTFKTPSTRGFNGSGNLRFNQLVDGMDNQAPGLNFSVGSIIGLNELDVDNMELLPGASSALYGPGGMNGTLLINSKNPFKYQGLSFQVKEGIMHVDKRERDVSAFHNWSLRYAEKISDHFAFKITTDLIQAKDWLAMDYRDYNRLGTAGYVIPGNRQTDPNFDGVNVYGDETTADLRAVFQGIAAQAPFLAPYINTLSSKPINVSRTGYTEKEVVNPNTTNFKLGGSLNFKLGSNTEAILEGFFGTGNTVYTGSDRYSLKDLKMAQYKLEFNNKNWFVRAYTTQENAGQSFNSTVTTRLLNEAWKPSQDLVNPTNGWYFQYGSAFLTGKINGLNDADAHAAARATADIGRPAAGSDQFNAILDAVRRVPISKGGGLFVDKTNLYNVEGQYNLSSVTHNFLDILVGGNVKKYVLNSEGTLFADSAGTIGITEYGAYVQAGRSLFNDFLKLTVSGRYDKNENFTGKFTPRATAVIKLSENNHLRLSYQTAYRFPSTQQQWINLNVGGGLQLIGGVPQLLNYYNFNSNPVYSYTALIAGSTTVQTFAPFKPESVQSYEAGYKGLLGNRFLIDIYGYYGTYQNFIVRTLVVQPTTGNPADLGNTSKRRIFSVPTNSPTKVKTYGGGISLDYNLHNGFVVSGNLSSDVLKDVPAGFIASFNAPKYRTNLSFANTGFGYKKRLGFNVIYRWSKSFYYEGDFGNGTVPEIQTVDAQVSYKLPSAKSVLKIGASNLLNQYYYNAFGNPAIGGLYYVSFGYNIF
jgi:outer membrane receptor protein involved in Fe transport